jgi:hypothetical protein
MAKRDSVPQLQTEVVCFECESRSSASAADLTVTAVLRASGFDQWKVLAG